MVIEIHQSPKVLLINAIQQFGAQAEVRRSHATWSPTNGTSSKAPRPKIRAAHCDLEVLWKTGNRMESFKGSFHHFSWQVFLTASQKKHWEHNISSHWYSCCPGAWKFQRQTQRIWNTSPFPMMLYMFQSKLHGLMHWHKSHESHPTSCIYQARPAPSRGLTRTSWAPTLSGDFCWWAVATNHWDMRTLWKQQVGRFLFHKIHPFPVGDAC